MIDNDAQLQQALEQMARMCRALAALRSDLLSRNRQQFAMMAEGPLEQIRRLEQEVSAYLGTSLESCEPSDTNAMNIRAS